MDPKLKKIHAPTITPTSSILQPDPILAFETEIVCLDQTHIVLKEKQEVRLSPTEYALYRLLYLGSRLYPFVPILTLELCFFFLTEGPDCLRNFFVPEAQERPVDLKAFKKKQENAEKEVSYLDLFLVHITLHLLHIQETIESDWEHYLPSLLHKYEAAEPLTKQERRVLQAILRLKYHDHKDVRKRISKHICGANVKFKHRGIGIQIFSVGQNKGYMASFANASPEAILI